jgi:hypothetical protein
MFRLFAVALVIAAFGATLYYSGNTLQAWESPQAAVVASTPSKKAERSHRSRKAAKKAAPRVPGWVVRLEALCRRARARTDAIRPPSSPRDRLRYLDDYARLNERLNARAVTLLQGSPARSKPQVKRFIRLLDKEEALVASVISAARNGQFGRLGNLSNQLLAVAKAENRVLIKMDAIACTVSPDVFRL